MEVTPERKTGANTAVLVRAPDKRTQVKAQEKKMLFDAVPLIYDTLVTETIVWQILRYINCICTISRI